MINDIDDDVNVTSQHDHYLLKKFKYSFDQHSQHYKSTIIFSESSEINNH